MVLTKEQIADISNNDVFIKMQYKTIQKKHQKNRG